MGVKAGSITLEHWSTPLEECHNGAGFGFGQFTDK